MTATDISVDAFLCDSVEGVSGKLYALGIGWNNLRAGVFPATHPRVGVGIVVHVPYTATNEQHELSLRIETADGARLPLGPAGPGADPRLVEDGRLVELLGQFNVGRPPELPAGDEQIVTMALQLNNVTFPAAGMYSAVISIDGEEAARLPFRLSQMQQSN